MGDRIAVFNQGRPEQIGTPEEIYEKPASRFVADFIGETNFVTTAVQRVGGGGEGGGERGSEGGSSGVGHENSGADQRLVVTLPGGDPVTLPKVVDTPNGEVTLTIRPERVSLTPTGVRFASGRISKLVYMGTDLRCNVTLADGTELAVRVPPPFPVEVQPDAEVSLYADPVALRPLTPETAAGHGAPGRAATHAKPQAAQ